MEPREFSPDELVTQDDWSDLARIRAMPDIDAARMLAYRQERLRAEMRAADVGLLVLVSPVSLRYAANLRSYQLYQSHIPTAYLFLGQETSPVLHGAYGAAGTEVRSARPLAHFDAGPDLAESARLLADDVVRYLSEMGSDTRRVAVEYVNPSITQALLQRGIEVLDGVELVGRARRIKSPDEIECMRWAIAVAELGIAKVREAVRPGITEVQLWGLLNYTNLANNGDWHDGRMLASGPRTNPWYQEATDRRVEAGDLVGFDTDMIGPYGYCADISRTVFCGPGRPSRRQKELYRLAKAEIDHNLPLMRPGMTLREIAAQAFDVPEEFHQQAYTCVIHGVGMSDEYPRVNPRFRGQTPYDGVLEPGMVVCVESYMGAVGERDGVKLEEQVLITDEGNEKLSSFPLEEILLD